VECESKCDRVITGASRAISKSLRQFLSNIPAKHEIKKIQKKKKKKKKKPAVLGTAHILRKVLMKKYNPYFTGEITLHVAQMVNKKSCNTVYP